MNDIDIQKYEDFNRAHAKGHILQSIKWANVKSNWINELVMVEKDGVIKGAMSILIRRLPVFGWSIMYAPRAPVCDIHDEETIGLLMQKTRLLAKKYRSFVFKMDPDISRQDAKFVEILKKTGFRIKSTSMGFEAVQARFVFRLDIKGKDTEQIMEGFHQKTRYNIRLASKKGVEIRIGTREDIPAFYDISLETGLRDGFITRNIDYFYKIYDCLGNDLKIFLAYHGETLIAGTFCVAYGNKAWYLYGASSNSYRNLMPNYLLQWEMIKWAHERGCEIYDFRGVPGDFDESNPLYGLYKFKKSFNGTFTEFLGDVDYVFNPVINFIVEKGLHHYRILRRKLYLFLNRKKTTINKEVETGVSSF